MLGLFIRGFLGGYGKYLGFYIKMGTHYLLVGLNSIGPLTASDQARIKPRMKASVQQLQNMLPAKLRN